MLFRSQPSAVIRSTGVTGKDSITQSGGRKVKVPPQAMRAWSVSPAPQQGSTGGGTRFGLAGANPLHTRRRAVVWEPDGPSLSTRPEWPDRPKHDSGRSPRSGCVEGHGVRPSGFGLSGYAHGIVPKALGVALSSDAPRK